MCLRPFQYAHLQVDAVAHDVHLGRVDLREHISVVVVVVVHAVLVGEQSFVDELLVVHVAVLHSQRSVQSLGVHHGVAHPCDVAQVVLVALFHFQEHVHVLVVFVPHRVFNDGGVAIAQLVILLDERLLGFGKSLGCVFLGFEEILEFPGLVYFAQCTLCEHSALQLRRCHLLVALDDDVAHLHLVFLVDVHLEHHLVFARHVVVLHDVDVGIFITFVVEVFLGQDLCAVHQVFRQAQSLGHSQFRLQVFALALFHSVVLHLADAWAQCQVDAEVDLRVDDAVGGDAHLREQSVLPVAFHGLRYFAARHLDVLSHAESRQVDEHIVLVVGYSFHGESSYLHLSWCSGVGDVGSVDEALRRCAAK